jgi:ankyrin repeat protein
MNEIVRDVQESTLPNDGFWQAVKEGTVQDVRRYIEKERVDVNAKDKDGMTALHHAVVFNSDVAVAKYLIEKGADVNAKSNEGWTPFHLAAVGVMLNDSKAGVGILLLENGADVYAKNSEGKTPLDLIMEIGALINEAALDTFRKAAAQGNPQAKEILQRWGK